MPREEPHRFRLDGTEVLVTSEHFGDALARATVVLGMAGAAHEAAAGLGKLVVAFPGTGPQFTTRFLAEQKRRLGDALVVAARNRRNPGQVFLSELKERSKGPHPLLVSRCDQRCHTSTRKCRRITSLTLHSRWYRLAG